MYTKAVLLAAFSATASALLPRQTLDTASPLPDATGSSSPECASRISSWTESFPTPAPALEDLLENGPEGALAQDGVEGLCDFASSLATSEAAAFTSYNLGMYSYLSRQSSNLLALATSCSTDMGAAPSVITSQLDELLTVYSSFSAGACKEVSTTGSSSATTTGSSSSSSTSSGSSGSAPSTSSSGSASSTTTSAATSVTTTATSNSSSVSSSIGSTTSSGSTANASSSPTVSQNAGPRETGMLAAAALAMGVLGAAVVL
ncbi:hypothetical protein F4804DRAFT_307235 [Jackrogersella minutella]|nr:hypothetical protein F4804DRAFT_307235 [Jackrogersella minutella]